MKLNKNFQIFDTQKEKFIKTKLYQVKSILYRDDLLHPYSRCKTLDDYKRVFNALEKNND